MGAGAISGIEFGLQIAFLIVGIIFWLNAWFVVGTLFLIPDLMWITGTFNDVRNQLATLPGDWWSGLAIGLGGGLLIGLGLLSLLLKSCSFSNKHCVVDPKDREKSLQDR